MLRIKFKLFFLAVTLLMINQIHPAIADDFISDRAGGKNVWYRYHVSPHAMYQDGKTFITFHGGGADYLDPLILSYEHATGKVFGPIKVGDNPLSALNDEHGNPALIVDNKGYIHVFYGGHGHIGRMMHAVSQKPGDIQAWKHLDNINPKATYPQLFRMSNGTFYYFYRKGNHRDDWVYVTSSDNGLSFGQETSVIQAGTKRLDRIYFDNIYYDSWYSVFWRDQFDTIHHITRYHACADDYRTPYHLERRLNVYYMKLPPKSNAWTDLVGRKIKTPLTREAVDACCRVFQSNPSKGEGKIGKIVLGGFAIDRNKQPHFIFGFGKGSLGRIDRKWKLAIGNSKDNKWELLNLPNGGQLTIDNEGTFRLWSSNIKSSIDRGKTWKKSTNIAKGFSGASLVVNGLDSAKIVGFDHRHEATDIMRRKVYLWGNEGFISRGDTKKKSQLGK